MQKSLIWLSYASLFLLGLADNIRGPLFPEILSEFSLSNSEGSLFFALSSGTIIPAGYIGGILTQKMGRLFTLRLSLVILCAALCGIALAPSFQLILVAVIIFGFALGTLGVVQNIMVIESAPPQSLQRWQSGLHSMYGLASLLAPLIVVFLFHIQPQWRNSFYFAAIIGVGLFLVTLFIRDRGINFSLDEKPIQGHQQTSKKQLLYFSCILGFYVACEILVGTRVAQLCRQLFHFDFSESANVNSLFFVMLFLGRVLFIFWQPNARLKTQLLISLASATICTLLGLFFSPYFLVGTGLAMAPFYPMMMTLAGRLFPIDLHFVTSFGVALSGVTVMLAQLIVGRFSDLFGLRYALLIGPLFSLIALLQIIQYKKIFNRDLP